MSLSNSNQSLPTFQILVDGTQISDVIEITTVSITEFPNEGSNAHISFIDGSPGGNAFPIANSDAFELDKLVEIKLGYDSVNKTCFKGVISSQTIKFDELSGQISMITCQNKATEKPTSTSSVLTLNYGDNVDNFSLTRQVDATTNKTKEFGQLIIPGTNLLRSGDLVTLSGFGQKFNGDFITRNIYQFLENGAWHTTVTLQFE